VHQFQIYSPGGAANQTVVKRIVDNSLKII